MGALDVLPHQHFQEYIYIYIYIYAHIHKLEQNTKLE